MNLSWIRIATMIQISICKVQSFDAVKYVTEVLCDLKCSLKLLRLKDKADSLRCYTFTTTSTPSIFHCPPTEDSACVVHGSGMHEARSLNIEAPNEQTCISHSRGIQPLVDGFHWTGCRGEPGCPRNIRKTNHGTLTR